jgi:hypothetical protein
MQYGGPHLSCKNGEIPPIMSTVTYGISLIIKTINCRSLIMDMPNGKALILINLTLFIPMCYVIQGIRIIQPNTSFLLLKYAYIHGYMFQFQGAIIRPLP